MSASYDRSQKFKFVYSNIYTVYKTGQGHEGFLVALKNQPDPDAWLKEIINRPTPSLWSRIKRWFSR